MADPGSRKAAGTVNAEASVPGHRIAQSADLIDFNGNSVSLPRYKGGFLVNPTPSGVPVRMTVPGSRVIDWLRKLMTTGI
jgi:hypothetical protein